MAVTPLVVVVVVVIINDAANANINMTDSIITFSINVILVEETASKEPAAHNINIMTIEAAVGRQQGATVRVA